MRLHRNAKLGLAGRRELVLAIAGCGSIREAQAKGVPRSTLSSVAFVARFL